MKPEKILLLDTEKNVLLSNKAALEDEGYQVSIATTEHDALSQLSQKIYVMLICEFYLKNSNTLKIINYIHKNIPETYIMILTASSLPPSTYEMVIEAGAQDCFMKPFPVKNLVPHIKKGIRRSQLVLDMKQLENEINATENSFSLPNTSNDKKYFFMQAFQQEQRRFDRYKHPFSLIKIDINSLPTKDFHLPSSLIEEIFSLFSSSVRQTDHSIALNNSYSIILPETTLSDTQNLTKRLGETINAVLLEKHKEQHEVFSKSIKFLTATYPAQSEKATELLSEISMVKTNNS